MSFSIRLFHRAPVHCFVPYNAGSFQGQGIVYGISPVPSDDPPGINPCDRRHVIAHRYALGYTAYPYFRGRCSVVRDPEAGRLC